MIIAVAGNRRFKTRGSRDINRAGQSRSSRDWPAAERRAGKVNGNITALDQPFW
jgi:hypothetical protein